MREDTGPQRYKLQWGKGRRETVQWVGYRLKGRLLPLLVARKLKALIRAKSRLATHGAQPLHAGRVNEEHAETRSR